MLAENGGEPVTNSTAVHASAYSSVAADGACPCSSSGAEYGSDASICCRPPADVLGHRVGDAEVDEDRTEAGKVLGNKDVGRLDVTMHDAALMGVVQRVGDLRQRREPLGRG